MHVLQQLATHAYASAPSGGDVATHRDIRWKGLPTYLSLTTLMVFRRRAEAIWMTACPTPLLDAFWMTESPVEEIQIKPYRLVAG